MGKAFIEITCSRCGAIATKRKDNVSAVVKSGRPIFCSIQCAKKLMSTEPSVEWITSKSTNVPSGCLEWNGITDKGGYGRITWRSKYGPRPVLVHRVMYELVNGQIPRGLCVCHRCDNPRCCEPAHLWIGTIAENNADMVSKGRNVSRKRKNVAATSTARKGETTAP